MLACRTLCEEHPKCLAFTFVKTEKACWLKGAGFTAKKNPNTVSGSVNITLAAQRRRAFNGSVDEERLYSLWRL